VTSEQFATGTVIRPRGDSLGLVNHRLRFECLEGPQAGQHWEVYSPRALLGTATGCDVTLTDRAVSRHHCELVVAGDGYLLRDLGSTNGTWVGQLQVNEARLPPGAELTLGDSRLLFQPHRKWVRVAHNASQQVGELLGAAPNMQRVLALLERIGPTRLNCILLGETGTGKELAARALHSLSERQAGPFVVVDCAAISPSLIEAELFGHERGAFTGAERARAGAFELAHGGTLFLDEIGELPLDLQPKLLRALERREVRRLGAAKLTTVDVRVLGATHRPLDRMVAEGSFREDLYFRLTEVVVELPPLRRRPEDIPLLAGHLLRLELAAGGPDRTLTPAALTRLQAHPWPGNGRELRNAMRRLATLTDHCAIGAEEVEQALAAQWGAGGDAPVTQPSGHRAPAMQQTLPPGVEYPWADSSQEARERANLAFEADYLRLLLQACNGDETQAARRAQVHIKTLQRLVRRHHPRPKQP
jgi:DNA-binding NtrC family response regulator